MNNQTFQSPVRERGFARLGDYAAIGEGRSVALIAPDGAIDWWCAPNLDSAPLFDRLLDPEIGGFFQIEPDAPYRTERAYRADSNVLETRFFTDNGSVLLTESLNSTLAGRLPWSELARRVEGVDGEVTLRLTLRFGTVAETRSPWQDSTEQGDVYHVGDLLAMLRTSEDWQIEQRDDEQICATLRTAEGSRSLVALLVTEREPLAVPPLEAIDTRIETSHTAWCDWTRSLSYQGRFAEHVRRSALSLKFLWYSPTGALAAAATTSLPEGIGGEKNYDYRYAWVRDACLIIKAFVFLGALEDCKAAFSWLSKTIIRHGTALRTCYTLEGNEVPAERFVPLRGYHHSQPVRVGNNARDQLQLSMYGDMLATAELFIRAGHVLDLATSRMLGALAEARHIEPTWLKRWQRERDRISSWIEAHCWNEEKQSYEFYPDSNGRLDAALALVHPYGSRVNPARMQATYRAIEQELGHGCAMLYRYSGTEQEESTFIACSFWLVEAWAALGECTRAENAMQQILGKLCQRGNVETFNEMFDVRSDEWRGNMPQGLSHLALICAAQALTDHG